MDTTTNLTKIGILAGLITFTAQAIGAGIGLVTFSIMAIGEANPTKGLLFFMTLGFISGSVLSYKFLCTRNVNNPLLITLLSIGLGYFALFIGGFIFYPIFTNVFGKAKP